MVVDQEHAPFDRVATDTILLAARASGIDALVRVPRADPSDILAVLDDGATGVLVPHVATPDRAREIVAASRYRGGRRGFSNSPRAGRYGAASIWEHVDAADAATVVLAMIEDPEALDVIDAIAAVEGLDGFFIGRGDLTVAFGAAAPDAPVVRVAVERIAAAARAAGKPWCAHVGGGDEAEIAWLAGLGCSAFIAASDQGLMRRAALGVRSSFDGFKAAGMFGPVR